MNNKNAQPKRNKSNFSNIISTPIRFSFSSYYSTEIPGAETDGRLKIKITSIPDSSKNRLGYCQKRITPQG